jgi:AcrR family transcriptional regulator
MAGRPRSFDRDTALATAVEQFWRTGYDETSIAALTAAMGVTAPSLYAAFGDKQRLFEEASALYFHRTCEGVDRAMARSTVREAVAAVLDDTALAHTDASTPPGCLMLTEPRLGVQRAVLRDKLAERIAQGVSDGDLPDTVQPAELASFLVAVMRGMSGCARDGGSTEQLQAIARTALAGVPEPPTHDQGRRRRPRSGKRPPT